MGKRLSLLAVLTVAMAALAFGACGGDDDAPEATPTPAGVKGTATPESELGKKINETLVPEESAEGKRLGPADAKVTILAYEDFGCPHCLDFTATIEPVILEEYVATGEVSFEYKYFPLRQLTGGAAIAAQCAAEQDKFWPYHRSLFIAQAEANAKVGPPLSEAFAVDNLKKIAADVGMDAATLDACIAGETALGVVQADLREANELALPGTPSFVINSKVTPAPASADGWRELLDDLLD